MKNLRIFCILVIASTANLIGFSSSVLADERENVRLAFQKLESLCDGELENIDTIVNSEKIRKHFKIDSISETDDGASGYIELSSRGSVELGGYIHLFQKDGHRLSQCGVSYFAPSQTEVGEFAKLVNHVVTDDLKLPSLGGKLLPYLSNSGKIEDWYSFVINDLMQESSGLTTVSVVEQSLQLDHIMQSKRR